MPRRNPGQHHIPRFTVVIPLLTRKLLTRRTVNNLPVFERFLGVVHSELVSKEILHNIDGQVILYRYLRIGDQKGLLQLVRILRRPFIMVTDDTDCGIDAVPRVDNFIRQLGAVTVTDHIRTPAISQLQCQLFISGFARQCKRALSMFSQIPYLLLNHIGQEGKR
ncbi:hypothetical protein D3C75_1047510 [compost metagenome]